MTVCFNHIWDEFSVPLKSFIKRRIPNEADADDIFQEVFIKIQNNIDGLKEEQKIHAWVYKITKNAIVDYYRRRNKSIILSELPEELAKEPEEDKNSNVEIAACLKAMIESLPEKYKKAIVLTEFQNLTQKELSDRMEISLSGAKSRVQRGKQKLKEMILECCQIELDQWGNVIDYRHKNSDCRYC
ncbi:MAG: RNA polymerase sigma factor SigZ [Bacteroides sp.]|nr:RNA polymerase sigma factor SigZ [Syntrophomonadaceae bacterium]MDD4055730.1 RNA polymerase sigma factor SigZ [Bacteroides sp.]MDD4549996.1 RNA polymerase sigma factor SigZ [Syntrophomonadaceae bacterium]